MTLSKLIVTGQTTVYRTGDDGDNQVGITLSDFQRFINNGDGTVTDVLTGLMWPQDLTGSGVNDTGQDWNTAIDWCEALSFGGHSDWRMPNVHELQSIFDYGSDGGTSSVKLYSIFTTALNVPSIISTSTTNEAITTKAYVIRTIDCVVNSFLKTSANTHTIPVRDGTISGISGEDPFTTVLKALWDLLEASSDFTSIVQLGNRVKLWTGSLKPFEKEEYSVNDLPEVTIEPFGCDYNPHATSTSGVIQQTYRIKLKDGDLKLHSSYFPLKWALMKALASADQLLSLNYVRKIEVQDGQDERNLTDHPGWNSGIDVVVHLWFPRTTLKA